MTDAFSEQVWPPGPTLVRLAIAVALGVFVGLEREHSKKTGVRTFALVALLGCLTGLTGSASSVWLAMSATAVLVALMNWRQMVVYQRLALTTSVALLIVAYCGFLTGQGHRFTPVVAAVATAALLAWKERIAGFVSVLSDRELRSAILLAILTFIVLPVLPSEPIDPWHLIQPKENWASVVIIAAIGFINYVLLRVLGPRGMEITAVFGGLVNSRKVVVELASRLQGNSVLMPVVERGILLATAAMALRNGIIVAVLAPSAAVACSVPLVFMIAASAGLWRWQRVPTSSSDHHGVALTLESPFSFSAALKFGLVFLLLNVVGALAQRHLGSSSFYFVSIAGGFLSSGSSIASAAHLVQHHEIPVTTGVNGVVLSSLTSAAINIPLVRKLVHDRALKRSMTTALLLVAAAGLLGMLFIDLAWPLTRRVW